MEKLLLYSLRINVAADELEQILHKKAYKTVLP